MGHLAEEWNQFIQSKTVKAIVATELGAVGLFVHGILDGTQHLDFPSLKVWLVFQAGCIFTLTLRHAMAGIEARLISMGLTPDQAKEALNVKDATLKE